SVCPGGKTHWPLKLAAATRVGDARISNDVRAGNIFCWALIFDLLGARRAHRGDSRACTAVQGQGGKKDRPPAFPFRSSRTEGTPGLRIRVLDLLLDRSHPSGSFHRPA